MSKANALLKQNVVILLSALGDGAKVQNALFALGCGFHNGTRLSPDLCSLARLHAVGVSRKGMMTVFLKQYLQDGSEPHYLFNDHVVIATDELLHHLSSDDNVIQLKAAMADNTIEFNRALRAKDLLYKVSRIDHNDISAEKLELLEKLMAD